MSCATRHQFYWEEQDMPETITLEQAQAHLAELIARMTPGEEVLITKDEKPVAKLVAQFQETRKPRQPGSAKGKLVILAEDDAHLEGFDDQYFGHFSDEKCAV